MPDADLQPLDAILADDLRESVAEAIAANDEAQLTQMLGGLYTTVDSLDDTLNAIPADDTPQPFVDTFGNNITTTDVRASALQMREISQELIAEIQHALGPG